MPWNGRSEIGLSGRAMDEKGRNGIPHNGQSESGIECWAMDEVRSAYQAGQWTKEGGMVFRNNGQSEIAAYNAGEWTKRDIGLPGRAMDEKERNGMPGKGRSEISAYQAGQ